MITYEEVATWPLSHHAIRAGVRPDDAEDAAQEALIYLMEHDVIGRWDPGRSVPLVAWIWTIIRFRFKTFIQRSVRNPALSLELAEVAEPADTESELKLRDVELSYDLDLVRQYLQSEHHSARSRLQLADFFVSLVRRSEGEIVSADVFNEWGEHTRQAVGNAKVRLRKIPMVEEVLRR